MPEADLVFESHRPALARLAYRMLGSLVDADDVLQEAFLRWSREDRANVRSPWSYLASIVTRLCIDARRAIEVRKETYVGPWLPDPIIETDAAADDRAELAESVSLAFLVALETLSPLERAAYLLRRTFDFDYGEIAAILGKSPENCRQLVSRAQAHVQARRPRFEVDSIEAERITTAFLSACASGELEQLVSLLADDAVMYSDGGGKAPAALAPVRGANHVARLFLGVLKKSAPGTEFRRVRVNGRPGAMTLVEGQVVTVVTFDIVAGRIATCFAVRNPEKLRPRVQLDKA
jgi:RNA polymerase sigma-70 factor, ECF subfamily